MKPPARLAIVGASAQGRVVLRTVQAQYPALAEIAFFDDDTAKHGTTVLGIAIAGSVEQLLQNADRRYLAAVAIGSNEARVRVARRIRDAGMPLVNVVHPSATVMPDVALESGILVCAGAVVVTGTTVANDAVINTGATIDHDCFIGAGAYISPGVHTAGGVSLGAGAFVGAGAVLGPGVSIGECAVVGAGSVVLDDIPARTFAYGAPARVIREISQPLRWSLLLGGKPRGGEGALR